jgi:hypothetical protein
MRLMILIILLCLCVGNARSQSNWGFIQVPLVVDSTFSVAHAQSSIRPASLLGTSGLVMTAGIYSPYLISWFNVKQFGIQVSGEKNGVSMSFSHVGKFPLVQSNWTINYAKRLSRTLQMGLGQEIMLEKVSTVRRKGLGTTAHLILQIPKGFWLEWSSHANWHTESDIRNVRFLASLNYYWPNIGSFNVVMASSNLLGPTVSLNADLYVQRSAAIHFSIQPAHQTVEIGCWYLFQQWRLTCIGTWHPVLGISTGMAIQFCIAPNMRL